MLSKTVMRTTALTIACAVGIGFYMQSTGAVPSVSGLAQSAGDAAPNLPGEPGPIRLQIENITLTSAAAEPAEMPRSTEEDAAAATCRLQARAVAMPTATVALHVTAPCNGGERLTVHHSGMSFTGKLDADGSYSVEVPALTQTAVFIAETASGSGAVAVADVPDLAGIDRVVLQWSGNSGFEIHAREFGAVYGGEGHVWHGAAANAGAGQVVRLGDESQLSPRIVEIYSLSNDLPGLSGTVALSAEAEVTGINCGRDITAQALQLRDGQLSSRDLVMAMPDCEAKGSFLVLNNLVEDLKIASN